MKMHIRAEKYYASVCMLRGVSQTHGTYHRKGFAYAKCFHGTRSSAYFALPIVVCINESTRPAAKLFCMVNEMFRACAKSVRKEILTLSGSRAGSSVAVTADD